MVGRERGVFSEYSFLDPKHGGGGRVRKKGPELVSAIFYAPQTGRQNFSYAFRMFQSIIPERIEYCEAYDRLLFGSHVTSPMTWIESDRQARTGDTV